jgi:hypothetical protein
LIDVDLAEDRGDDGVYVRGSSAYLDWVADRVEAARLAGKKSGERRRARKKTEPNANQNEPKPTKRNVLEPSVSSSSSVSDSENTGITLRVHGAGAESLPEGQGNLPGIAGGGPPGKPKRDRYTPEVRAKMHAFLATYAACYRARYGGPPEGIRDPAMVNKVGTWIGGLSTERAKNLIEVYLQIDHRPIAESQHDLWQFFRNLNRIGNALSTGQDPAGINWDKVFGGAA